MFGLATWKVILRINLHFLAASLGFALAWAIWDLTATGLEILRVGAVIFAFIGLKQTCLGLIGILKVIADRRKWRRYRAQGVSPKADQMANEAVLRARGLIR